MRRMLKSYLVFTSAPYRIVMYVLVPIGMIGISTWAGSRLGEAALLLTAMLLTMLEVISDSWLFGGIQARDPEKIDYLKTSGRGMRLLRNALVMDLARKFLYSLWVVGVGYFVLWLCGISSLKEGGQWGYGGTGTAGIRIGILLCFALTSYFFSAFGTFLSRFGSMFWINWLIGYPCMIFTALCPPLMVSHGYHKIWFCNLFSALLCAGISVLAVKIAMRKCEGGYYDK